MSSPSSLGDLGYQIACVPATTSTKRFMVLRLATCSDTGTVTVGCSGRILNLSLPFCKSATGGYLDETLHPRPSAARQFRSVGIAIPLELSLLASGKQVVVTATHKSRSSTAGAGSTWATIVSESKVFKQGTTTSSTYHLGFVSSINAQAAKKWYRCNLTFGFRKGSSTALAAQDTTTAEKLVCNSPVYLLFGANNPANNF